jgi:hypothetical protein
MIFFYIGCALLVAAFVAAGAETVARVQAELPSAIMSAYELWYTLWPASLIHSRIVIERDYAPFLWDPLATTLLVLPAWLIIGAPGAVLFMRFRPRRDDLEELDEDALFVFDDLACRAREDGYEEKVTDVFPEHHLDWANDQSEPPDDPDSPEERGPGELPDGWQR